MFGEPGTAYIYTIYGIHQCLNVVAPRRERAAAILIRAVEPVVGELAMAERRGYEELEDLGNLSNAARRNFTDGPGKLCRALEIDTGLDGRPLDRRGLCLLAPEVPVVGDQIARAPRIGLNPETCGEAVEWAWRYVCVDSEYLSRPVPG
jgi:DNA-3-methyladenine glycosylase